MLVALTRCVQAQPILKQPEVWDLSFLFDMPAKTKHTLLLKEYLCRVIRPEFVPTLANGPEFVSQYLLNKNVESRCSLAYPGVQNDARESSWVDGTHVVNTGYLN